MYEDRNYLIFPISEINKINFSEVCETSSETLRFSISGDKSFIKWDGEAPAFVADIVGAEGPYTHTEILELLSGAEWTAPMEPVLVRARNADGTFIGDDPSTPDVNEAWTTP